VERRIEDGIGKFRKVFRRSATGGDEDAEKVRAAGDPTGHSAHEVSCLIRNANTAHCNEVRDTFVIYMELTGVPENYLYVSYRMSNKNFRIPL
jgi:hypothetical protein